MVSSGSSAAGGRPNIARQASGVADISPEHYLLLIWHRKWLVLGVFAAVALGTALFSYHLPDIFAAETLILVDPQRVPEAYVKSTVTGDVRNRLGTLSQQILSATRLQKIIESLNLYPEERKKAAREDVILRMRKDIGVSVVSDFGGSQDLQAFRIRYSGTQPRLVAQVTNQLAALFIEENLKAREQQATSTTEFLHNQLEETRKTLEAQEAKLKDFKLKHLGEMPEYQAANLQMLGQLQSQLQMEADAISRAEQQKSYIQSLMAQGSPVVIDMDSQMPATKPAQSKQAAAAPKSQLAIDRARLKDLLTRYTEKHPDIQKLKRQIAEEEAKQKEQFVAAASEPAPPPPAEPVQTRPAVEPRRYVNPVLQTQLTAAEAEMAKHKEEQQRLSKAVASYRAKVEAIPLREQQIADLVRDYEISKAHYKQLLEKQLSAETATQLEIRQKGEKFTVLDPAQVPERPASPNRALINAAGSAVGLGLGLMLAIATEFLGMCITAAGQITSITALPVLEVIPRIQTAADRRLRRRKMIWAGVSAAAAVLIVCGVVLYRYRTQLF